MSRWFRPKNEQDIIAHIKKEIPSFYLQSKTSTVINYNQIESFAQDNALTLVDLSQIKAHCEWKDSETIKVKGATKWLDLKNFALTKGRRVMTSPTEELAGVLAGLATSCTGEHAFGYGTLRQQVVSCRFLNQSGDRVQLENHLPMSSLGLDAQLLSEYSLCYEKYQHFKNAPFSRFQQATDLMIGTEGQLGVITEAMIKTAPLEPSDYYLILVPRWENNYLPHLEILEKVQDYRGKILTVELIDWNSLSYLPKAEWSQKEDHDVIFMEVLCKNSEEIFENILARLEYTKMEDVFSFDEGKFSRLRKAVPRFVNEINSKKGVIKKGTDVQVPTCDMKKLFDYYRDFAKIGIPYNLFGHLGDSHLHFNFLPGSHQVALCDEKLNQFYNDISSWDASPFAEHGIGLIKQKYIRKFWNPAVMKMFSHCKDLFDPKRIFFPQGFMRSNVEI